LHTDFVNNANSTPISPMHKERIFGNPFKKHCLVLENPLVYDLVSDRKKQIDGIF